MRYDDRDRESSNVEDRRGQSGSPFGRGGMRFPIPIGRGGRGGFSITTILIIGAIMMLFGINPLDILQGNFNGASPGGGGGSIQIPQFPRIDPGSANQRSSPFEIPGRSANTDASQDEMKKFVGRVLADTEDVWGSVFKQLGRTYKDPKLVIFSGAYPTACGTGQAAMGPFYCPLDQKIYIDLAFYDELKRRFHAPGDFAQAYVVAHEVGHHVQTLLGIADQVQRAKARASQRDANRIQVRMELQADCFAGVWAALTQRDKNRLQPGDVEEGLNAAQAIGDDMIQKQTTGRVVPDAFTHGTSAQRVRWFRRGLESGQIRDCDTFNAPDL
ncbi:MAG: neutral zinc metallopeptidase [Hyphomicrobiaceae bacterium]